MKIHWFLIILSIMVLMGCEKDTEATMTYEASSQTETLTLVETGILGQWKLENRLVNGISDLAIECCDSLLFQSAQAAGLLEGEFTASGVGYIKSGEFELNTFSSIIHFDYNNTEKIYGYEISEDVLTFTYQESNQEITEGWRKLE